MSFQPSAISQKRSGPKLTADRRSLTAVCAFTLVELLAVIAIIAILAGLTLGIFRYAHTRSVESRIRAEIKALELAIEAYKLDKGAYPASANSGTTKSDAIANSKRLYQALSGNSTGTGLSPDPGNKAYFTAFREGKNGNIIKDTDGKYYIVDAVGWPYNYISGFPAAQQNKVSFDLWSYGLDQTHGTADDIANWKF